MIEQDDAATVTETLEQLDADLLTITVSADLAQELQAHQEEAYASIEPKSVDNE